MEKTIIVLGKGRGGTSITARILKSAGVNMGKDLKPAIPINPEGCFENYEFLNLTQGILKKAKCFKHRGVVALIDGFDTKKAEQKVLDLQGFSGRIRKVVANNRSKLWGWKDERSCFVIKRFLPHLENPHFVVVHRNMYSVARSLDRCDGTNIKDGLSSALTFYKKIFEFLNEIDYPTFHLTYESLFTDEAQDVVDNLCKFIGVKKKVNVNNIVNKKLRNFT